jgi:serine/threonine-protein kinase
VPPEPADHADDLLLAAACLRGEAAALAQLEARVQLAARKAFAGKRLDAEDERDVVQNVLTHLLVARDGETPRLASYAGAGPLDGWLRVTLSRAGISRLRALASQPPRAEHEDAEAEVAAFGRAVDDDPELATLRARYSEALSAALKESIAALAEADRGLVREHYLEGLTIDDLAALHQTHRATAARRLARARHKVLEGTRSRMMLRFGLGPTELGSLLGALMSGLDWTLRPALDAWHDEVSLEKDEPSFAELGAGVVVAGRFELTRFLGTGGSAVVWAARSLADGAEVALKICRTDDPDLGRRFEREAAIAASFLHPNVARIFEAIAPVPGRGPCLVQELVRGETLQARLDARGTAESPAVLSLREAAELALPVADALAAAHDRGIVHRDLKPQNVMIADRVVVLDFGIAKLLPSFGAHTRLTRTGAVLGTPRYMAPEQLDGARDIDARADVWAFAALLYRMLAGRSPVDASTTAGMIRALSLGPPPPIAALVPDLPPALAELVSRALVVDRGARLSSLRELLPLLAMAATGGGSGESAPSR